MKKKKVLMIINPRAGKMTFRNSFYSVVKRLSNAGCAVNIYFTTCSGDAAETLRVQGEEYDLVIACGGDGTFNEVVNGVLKLSKKVSLGYIPCGSTNDFASTLGITGTPVQIVDDILFGDTVCLDVGKFNERYFTYTASFGAFTAVSYDTPQNLKNAFGHFAYVLNGAKQLANLPKVRLRLESENYSEEGVYFYGGVTNTTSIGGLYALPEDEVVLDDGELELLMVRVPTHPQEYNETLLNLAVRNFDDPNILFMHGRKFIFRSEEELAFTLDGEYGGSSKVNEISCIEKAYSINGKLK